MGTAFVVPNPLPLDLILPVTVVIEPTASAPAFNQALIVGPSAVIPSVGANSRTRLYESLIDMLAGGFTTSMPEYKAAGLYFGAGATYLWAGRQDLTAIAAVAIGTGSPVNYVAGDIVTVTQGGAQAGQVLIVTVNGGGTPTAVSIIPGSQGTGYSVANNLPTTGGSGTGGLTINITAIGETPLQAVTACRANPQWYACHFAGTAADSDQMAIASYIESVNPKSRYFATTTGFTGDVGSPMISLAAAMQVAAFTRTFLAYSTTQSGAYPSNIYAAAYAMGQMMALNTGLPGSYFNLMYKNVAAPGGGVTPAGVAPEPLSLTQVAAYCGLPDRSAVGLNLNCVLQWQNGGIWWNYGVSPSGMFVDILLFLDMLSAAIQQNGLSLLQSLPSIPITNAGCTSMQNAVSQACVDSQNIGFIAPSGTWLGPQLGAPPKTLALNAPMPKGYWVYQQPVSTWPQARRANRVMPPITVALILAQAGQSLAVTVYVQQ
jgi:hypothetical protein